MESRLQLEILPQPSDTTCGPTCLHALYRYYGDTVSLPQLVAEIPVLEGGGTLGVLLGCHALRRGYDVQIITYNLQAFDPTWFTRPDVDLRERLRRQREFKSNRKLHTSTAAYLDFLDLGGRLGFEDLTPALIRRHLSKGVPILTGLSSTYLYRDMREYGPNDDPDDVRGEPAGHFVVLCGYHREERTVLVADPLEDNPVAKTQQYDVSIDRLICAILLGVLTYDANLLIIRPKRPRSPRQPATP